MSDELWSQAITAASTLIATGLGGWIGWLTASRQHAQQSQADARRKFIEKMEQLHEALTKLSGQIHLLNTVLLGQAANVKLPNLVETLGGHLDTGTINRIVDFYAPTLRPEATALGEGLQKIAIAMSRLALQRLSETEKSRVVESGVVGYADATKAIDNAKAKLNGLVSPLTALPGQAISTAPASPPPKS